MKNTWLILSTLFFQMVFSQSQSANYYTEAYRPQFHFTPEAKWMNDPNGLIYSNGIYHLFYQYYPDDIVWGPMHWGHAESTDMLHWKHLPIALYPDKLGYIFSGSAVIDKENTASFGKNAMIAIFTYHDDEKWKKGIKNMQSQGIAYSLDEGKTWTKYEANPVLNNTGEQDFRDPKVFWNETVSKWNMVLAVGDRIRIFSSTNLKSWVFESDFKPTESETLGVWECPDLFPMKIKETGETKWVLIVNHGDKCPNGGSGTRYFVGDFNGKTFSNFQKSIWLDYGTDFYAGVTYANVPNNQRLFISWMSNWQYATKVPTSPWRSAMTLPRTLELEKEATNYFIKQQITPQFSTLLKPVFESENLAMPLDKKVDLSQTEITFDTNSATDIMMSLSNAKGEVFNITLSGNKLVTDRSQSGQTKFSETFATQPQVMPLHDEITSFQIILDKSSVEILLNGGKYSMTNQFFPNENYSDLGIITKNNIPLKHFKINTISNVWR